MVSSVLDFGDFWDFGLKRLLTVKINERNGEGRRNKMEDLGQICSEKRRRAESWSRKFSEKMRKKEGSGGYINIFSDGILSSLNLKSLLKNNKTTSF